MATEPWDEDTIDVAFDALHEATGKRDIAEANRLAQLIQTSVRRDQLSIAIFLGEAWGELDNAVCVGAAGGMFGLLTDHACKTNNAAIFKRLLASPFAERVLGHAGYAGLLPTAFIGALVDSARVATSTYRYAACSLISNQERLFKLDIAPLGEFLFSCFVDQPSNPRESSAKLAGWLIDEHIRRGRDRGGWRDELTRRASGRDAPALIALRSHAKLAALDADATVVAQLLAERGSRLDTTLDGIDGAFRMTAADERASFAARLQPLLRPIQTTGSAKQKKLVASLLERFAAKPRRR